MKRTGHESRTGDRRGVYRASVVKREGRRLLGRCRHKWEDNIKIDLEDMEWIGIDWIDMSQDKDGWWALVNKVMNLRVSQNVGNFLNS
jgi:hypothetical protein